MSTNNYRWRGFFALGLVAAVGCSDERGEDTRGSGLSGLMTAAATASATGGATDTGSQDTDDGPKLDVGVEDTTGSAVDTDQECAAVSENADVALQPADIIFIVDTSDSMDFEASSVQAQMNAFSTQIVAANLDAHVVLISDTSICISAPLGSGMCPADNNMPGFTHINVGVGSTNGLELLIQQYPNFVDLMRPNAAKHIVVVSDDDSGLGSNAFTTMFNDLDPSNVGFTLHGIVADSGPLELECLIGGNPCCLVSAAPGDVYLDLIAQTGGVFGNLCLQDFQPVFNQLATAVLQGATLSCEFEVPEPPDGETFDPDKVNIEFDDGTGMLLSIGRVDSAADCLDVADGWYYDNPDAPTQILVCPQTCTQIQGFMQASIEIQFGCETVEAPPVG